MPRTMTKTVTIGARPPHGVALVTAMVQERAGVGARGREGVGEARRGEGGTRFALMGQMLR